MTTPKIHALGITPQGSPTRWKAAGYVDGIGWLEAWGKTLIEAMEALQALAAQRGAEGTREAQLLTNPPDPLAARQRLMPQRIRQTRQAGDEPE